jgi:hypothetical protein
MKKVIKLTETDLINIVKRVLNEQPDQKFDTPYNKGLMSGKVSDPNTLQKTYSCVPDNAKLFVNYVIINKNLLTKKLNVDYKTLILLTKASVGIMGRETKFGNFTEFYDTASETLRGAGLGSLVDWYIKRKYGEKGTQSIGISQFTPETWKRYGLDKSIGDFDSSLDTISMGLGTLYSLTNRYKRALSNGLKPEPSVNPILKKYGVIQHIKGTGNHALDMSILSHNMPEQKTIYPYCTTNHPLYAAPCRNTKISPFKSKEKFNPESALLSKVTDPKLKNFPGVLTVNTSDIIPNYFPNLGGPKHTGIGYVEEVAKYINSYNCF